ncbi:MAG: hypothetical protein KF900_14580 [Bacteroidetes bacterium]|nr:hypothetical protein [Bacteroidota bacterium]
MNKTWLGYLSSILLLFAGIILIIGEEIGLGILFIAIGIIGLVLKIFISRKNKRK